MLKIRIFGEMSTPNGCFGGGDWIWTSDSADMSRMLWPPELHRQRHLIYLKRLNCQWNNATYCFYSEFYRLLTATHFYPPSLWQACPPGLWRGEPSRQGVLKIAQPLCRNDDTHETREGRLASWGWWFNGLTKNSGSMRPSNGVYSKSVFGLAVL